MIDVDDSSLPANSQSKSLSLRSSNEPAEFLSAMVMMTAPRIAIIIVLVLFRPTRPSTLNGTEHEYRLKYGDALRLGSKGRYGSFPLRINVWVAGKTV